jgi:hypothetical protein
MLVKFVFLGLSSGHSSSGQRRGEVGFLAISLATNRRWHTGRQPEGGRTRGRTGTLFGDRMFPGVLEAESLEELAYREKPNTVCIRTAANLRLNRSAIFDGLVFASWLHVSLVGRQRLLHP